ncbi:hypothetical protein M0811_13189 [Anaeramoeba ignava]|uniref:Uncharacterized protein n=1 Tax=Anaeramoeba ignava TaxID=1746090 RepID=A0A9Q0L824_ANAIG|nr:hypothetical protein M0811_13189 [Anaeramoeba ignava]
MAINSNLEKENNQLITPSNDPKIGIKKNSKIQPFQRFPRISIDFKPSNIEKYTKRIFYFIHLFVVIDTAVL